MREFPWRSVHFSALFGRKESNASQLHCVIYARPDTKKSTEQKFLPNALSAQASWLVTRFHNENVLYCKNNILLLLIFTLLQSGCFFSCSALTCGFAVVQCSSCKALHHHLCQLNVRAKACTDGDIEERQSSMQSTSSFNRSGWQQVSESLQPKEFLSLAKSRWFPKFFGTPGQMNSQDLSSLHDVFETSQEDASAQGIYAPIHLAGHDWALRHYWSILLHCPVTSCKVHSSVFAMFWGNFIPMGSSVVPWFLMEHPQTWTWPSRYSVFGPFWHQR